MKATLIVIVFALSVISMACDDGYDLSFENRTEHAAIIYFDDRERIRLAPHEIHRAKLFRFPESVTYTLLDERGATVETGTLDFEDEKLGSVALIIK